ncbi:nuclear transport factor 2 family protein [Rhizobium sp. BK251]|uniref:nuclear transport factor 2 family protein n=1 Tax=Rhizobium sp. BK251 TaxID=2512125 RepID=UPI00104CB83D|nr:nuclear transport factor 2 family protein [Rhizobium sp. BK251]TCL71225.1 SnoaL-like protein [Rhizobium sp. BK251]
MTSRGEIETIIHALYNARNDRDIETIRGYLHPDCSFRIVGNEALGAITQKMEGRDAVCAAVDALIEHWDLSDVRIFSMHIDGDTAFVHRGGPVGFLPRQVWNPAEMLDKFTFLDGKMLEFVEFADTLLISEMLGLKSPAP